MIRAINDNPDLRLIDGNESALELHLMTKQGVKPEYYLDIKISAETVTSSIAATARAEKNSKEAVEALTSALKRLVDYVCQNANVKKK